ncbi:unnamed protein product [Dibothriocephalus latus]|uniref:Uncharacterized protein n=1 Tax=Dibothriocephalus latus TaxID=60516 RepID=A0A3P7Q9V7_DIBLA|nr:unnamed protein product [Dibothriocephalus latus]
MLTFPLSLSLSPSPTQCQGTLVQFITFLSLQMTREEMQAQCLPLEQMMGEYYVPADTAFCLFRSIFNQRVAVVLELPVRLDASFGLMQFYRLVDVHLRVKITPNKKYAGSGGRFKLFFFLVITPIGRTCLSASIVTWTVGMELACWNNVLCRVNILSSDTKFPATLPDGGH